MGTCPDLGPVARPRPAGDDVNVKHTRHDINVRDDINVNRTRHDINDRDDINVNRTRHDINDRDDINVNRTRDISHVAEQAAPEDRS